MFDWSWFFSRLCAAQIKCTEGQTLPFTCNVNNPFTDVVVCLPRKMERFQHSDAIYVIYYILYFVDNVARHTRTDVHQNYK